MQGYPVPKVPQGWCIITKQSKHALELLHFYGASAVNICETPKLGNS